MTPLDAFGARRRQLLTGSGAIALGGLLGTPALWAQTGAVTYEPERGQSGKDVIWIPTPDTLVNRMLRMAQVTPKDYVIDLGSGDGKIVIAAAPSRRGWPTARASRRPTSSSRTSARPRSSPCTCCRT